MNSVFGRFENHFPKPNCLLGYKARALAFALRTTWWVRERLAWFRAWLSDRICVAVSTHVERCDERAPS
jgi:hypothetical protein